MHHDQLDAFLFSHPNPSNKTGDDLQDLIEGIPYPTEDLSLTSFESSENTPSRPNPLPLPSKQRFYTQVASDEKSQKSEKPTNSNNFNNSSTPHRVNLIKDWSKLHVTPGDSKNIFPQVMAPSIEFSHDNLNSNKKIKSQLSPNSPSPPSESEKKESKSKSSYFQSNISKKVESLKNEEEKESKLDKNSIQANLAKKLQALNLKNSQTSEAILCSDQTQEEIMRLRTENETLSNQLVFQRKVIAKQEKETEFLAKRITELENPDNSEHKMDESDKSMEIEKQKLLCQGYRTRVSELEGLLRNEEEIRKAKEDELRDREEELHLLDEEKNDLIAKVNEMKEVIMNLEEDCRKKEGKLLELKEAQELFFLDENNTQPINKENANLINEFSSLRQNYDQILVRKDMEIAELKLLLKQKNSPIKEEPSFGRGSSSCDHKSHLLNFFKDIGYKEEEEGGGLDVKNYAELMEILYSVFGNMQEQFEQIYHERNEYEGKIREIEEKYGEWEKMESNMREFEREKEAFEEAVNNKNKELEVKMRNIERRMGELALKERESTNTSFRRTVQNEVDLRNLEEYQLKLKNLRENQVRLETQQDELKRTENNLLKLREELDWKEKELKEKNRIMDENIEEYKKKISSMKKSQSEYDEKSENEMTNLKNENKQLQEELTKVQKSNTDLLFQIKKLESDQMISFANENSLNKEIEGLKVEKNKIKNDLETQLNALQAKVNDFANKKSNIEELNQALRTEKTLKVALEEELKTLKFKENELDQLMKEKDRKNIELFKEIRVLSENNRILEENLNLQKSENEKKTKILKEKTQDLKTLSTCQKTNIELQLNNKNQSDKIEELQSKIIVLSNRNEEFQSKIGFLSAKNEELVSKSDRNESSSVLRSRLDDLQSELPNLQRNLNFLISKIETLEKIKENLENEIRSQNYELEPSNKRNDHPYYSDQLLERLVENPAFYSTLMNMDKMGVLEKILNENFLERILNEKFLDKILNENVLDRSSTETDTVNKNLNLVMEWLDGLEMLSGEETIEVLEELLRKIGGSKMMRKMVQEREVIRYMMHGISEEIE